MYPNDLPDVPADYREALGAFLPEEILILLSHALEMKTLFTAIAMLLTHSANQELREKAVVVQGAAELMERRVSDALALGRHHAANDPEYQRRQCAR